MRGILNTVLLVPGDYVYVVTDLEYKTVLKSEVYEVKIRKDAIRYVLKEGAVKHSKAKGFEPGQRLPCMVMFKNSDIDTRSCVRPWEMYVFKSKEKCLKFIRGE